MRASNQVSLLRRVPRLPSRRHFWGEFERRLLSTGLTLMALVADWLLARRLDHDRKQTAAASTPTGGRE